MIWCGLNRQRSGHLGFHQAATNKAKKSPTHFLTGQGVDDGVHCGIDDGQSNKPVGFVQDRALLDSAGHVNEEEDEQWRPACNEDTNNDHNSPKECHGPLRVVVVGDITTAGLNQYVDTGIKDDNGDQNGYEDTNAEHNILFGVKRQNC